jgi:hypothetical protein
MWNRVSDLARTTQAILTSLAIIAGGIWFWQRGEMQPRANVEHVITYEPLTEHYALLHVQAEIRNEGKTRLHIRQARAWVQQILPLVGSLREEVEHNGPAVVNADDHAVNWTLVPGALYDRSDLSIDIEPGEAAGDWFEFVIPREAKTVRLYTYFRNQAAFQQGADTGWSSETIYQVQGSHD